MIRLWDLGRRQVIRDLGPISAAVRSLAFSPDGVTVASGWKDGRVRLWNVTTGSITATLEGQRGFSAPLAFSPDGATLAAVLSDSTVTLWSLETETESAVLRHDSLVSHVAFSPDGATLASATWNSQVHLWDPATGAYLAALEGHGDWVNGVAFSPDGTTLAASGSGGLVKLWDVMARRAVATLDNTAIVRSMTFSPDGATLACASEGVAKLWDTGTRAQIDVLPHTSSVEVVAFSPDGKILASGTWERVELWDASEWLKPRPHELVKISGDGQRGVPEARLESPLVVEVRDQYGNGIAGAPVTFAVTSGDGRLGGRFTVENTETDASGRAEGLVTLGSSPGATIIEARLFKADPANFRAVAVEGPLPPIGEGNPSKWHLPDMATLRLGKGSIGAGDAPVVLSPDGRRLAVATTIGIWLYDVETARELALFTHPETTTLAFSPDGATLVSGGYLVTLWDVVSGAETASLPPGGGRLVQSLAVSPDGTVLAAAAGRTVRLWDVATRSNTATLAVHADRVQSLAFLRDGATLVAKSGSGALTLWDVSENLAGSPLQVHAVEGSLALSPDGATLAAASGTRIELWDVTTDTLVATLVNGTEAASLAFSPDGTTLAAGSWETVTLWDVARSQMTTAIKGHERTVHSLTFSPDGSTLAAGSWRLVKLLDVAAGTGVATLNHSTEVLSVAFTPDGATLAVRWQESVLLWEVTTRSVAHLPGYTLAHVNSVAFSPDGTTLASGSHWAANLWDVTTGQAMAKVDHGAEVTSVVHLPDGVLAIGSAVPFGPFGSHVPFGSHDDTIRLWDVARRRDVAIFRGPRLKAVWALAVSPGGATVAAGYQGGSLKLWDVTRGQAGAPLKGHADDVVSVAFSPDGATLASGSRNQTLRVWDVESGSEIATLKGRASSLAFSPDGATLAVGGGLAVRLWDATTWKDVTTLDGHGEGRVVSVAFSPDGATLAAGGTRTLELWDTETWRKDAALKGHIAEIRSLDFSPDGTTLATGSTDGTILVWDLTPQPHALKVLSGDSQQGLPGVLLPGSLVVEIGDENGDPLEGVRVTFAVTGGGGTLSVTRATTDARGRAATTLTLGQAPGPNTVEVTVGDLEPVVFTALTRAVATTLSIVGGDAQQGPSGSPLTEPLVVSLLDQVGSPLAGAAVTFAVTAGGGTLSVTRATTDAQGRATTTLTLGSEPGTNTVEATVADLEAVTFIALGVAVPRTLTKLSGDEQSAEPGEQLAEPLVVSVRDQNGAAYAGAVVTFALTGDGGTLSAVTDTTDAEGRAATTLTLGEEYGTYTVVATVADLERLTFTVHAKASPDFDGDGEVGFSDFFVFAEAFGGGDPRFDLDGSGTVDFADFFLFAEHFGQPARAKLVALARELIGLPDGPQLRQNAPNPFNSGTVISWLQLQPGLPRLEVFALTGQRVAVLHEGPRKAGLHRLRWDGRDDRGRVLASGVYVYRLVTAEVVQTRKLTLLR